MSRYRQVSNRIFEIFQRFTPLVEPLSIDEAFLDVTGSTSLFGCPEEIAIKIKKSIAEETGLTASAGVGPSKFIAKIASDLKKPDGLTIVPSDKVEEFLDPLPIGKLWGVGRATHQALTLLSVRTIGDLRRLPPELLESKFGKHGTCLYLLSRAVDERDVEPYKEAKSIGNEKTYMEDILDIEVTQRELLALATKVARRLRKNGAKGKTVTLKVKYKDFVQTTRSLCLPETIDDGGEIYKNCCELLKKTEAGKRAIRLLGVSVALPNAHTGPQQLSLFCREPASARGNRLNRAIDRINEKFGEDKILPGTLLEK
jgi:DNA polymerase-4